MSFWTSKNLLHSSSFLLLLSVAVGNRVWSFWLKRWNLDLSEFARQRREVARRRRRRRKKDSNHEKDWNSDPDTSCLCCALAVGTLDQSLFRFLALLFIYLFIFCFGGREGFFSFFFSFFSFFSFFFFSLRLVKISSKVPSIHKFGILDMMPASVSK